MVFPETMKIVKEAFDLHVELWEYIEEIEQRVNELHKRRTETSDKKIELLKQVNETIEKTKTERAKLLHIINKIAVGYDIPLSKAWKKTMKDYAELTEFLKPFNETIDKLAEQIELLRFETEKKVLHGMCDIAQSKYESVVFKLVLANIYEDAQIAYEKVNNERLEKSRKEGYTVKIIPVEGKEIWREFAHEKFEEFRNKYNLIVERQKKQFEETKKQKEEQEKQEKEFHKHRDEFLEKKRKEDQKK